MTRTITLKDLRPKLPQVADTVESKMDRYVATRRGHPVMVLMSPEDLEGLLETIEILSDRSSLKRIRKSWQQAKTGKTIALDELKKRLSRV